ncbi:hypothetical protein [Micromonospora zhanjiangensis]
MLETESGRRPGRDGSPAGRIPVTGSGSTGRTGPGGARGPGFGWLVPVLAVVAAAASLLVALRVGGAVAAAIPGLPSPVRSPPGRCRSSGCCPTGWPRRPSAWR